MAEKKPMVSKPILIVAGVLALATVIIAIPRGSTTEEDAVEMENPQARAEELIEGLIVRLGEEDMITDWVARPDDVSTEPVRDLFQSKNDRTRRSSPDAASSPTARAGQTAPPSSSTGLPVLGGLMFDRGRRVAILNGKAVMEGEIVNGYTVAAIEDEAVTIEKNGKSRRMPWKR